MTMNLRFLAFSLTAAFVFAACNSSEEPKTLTNEGTDSTDVMVDSTATMEEDHTVSYNLPSALQIASVFKKSGAAYLPSITNTKENVTKYNTSNYKKAVNFGIYSADLAYCLSNKKYQESKEYLKACHDLGSYLGINKAFESDLMLERFDRNISNEDSLIKIVTGIQLNTDVMFEENKQRHVKLLALVGAWTESLYIASEAYQKDKSKKVGSNLVEQLFFSRTIVKALNDYKDTEPEIAALSASVENISVLFFKIPSIATAVEKDENMDLSAVALTDAELKPILTSIKTLRTDMVN